MSDFAKAPAPDATGKCGELVTLSVEMMRDYAFMKADPDGDYVTRSQAVELLAAKDDHIAWLKNHLEAAQGRAKNAAINSAKFEKLLAAERARFVEASQRATNEESFKDTMRNGLLRWKERAEKAEADNAALTARVKELEETKSVIAADKAILLDLAAKNGDLVVALEAKLAAAEKALESLSEKGRKVLDVLKAWEDDGDLVNSGKIVSDFRAELGGKPS